MPRVFCCLIFASIALGWQTRTKAQDIVVPAGTLLHCTLEEPNFSSSTASIGDPVICHLSSVREFGQVVFPRGSYVGGHLATAKKDYLKLEFDRIGFESSEIPVPNKVIAARGFHVDREGRIVGHHYSRPVLKGEEQITLRLMDDIKVPRMNDAVSNVYRPQSSNRPASFDLPQQSLTQPANNVSGITYLPPSVPALADESGIAYTLLAPPSPAASNTKPLRLTSVALKSDAIFEVASYRIDSERMYYMRPSGVTGSVSLSEVDWRKTSQLNADPNVSSKPKTH